MLFKLTREEALKFDLLVCSCGHRPNNHFDFGSKSCAHCKCKKYDERPRIGKIVKPNLKKIKKLREELSHYKQVVINDQWDKETLY